jgi:hypothetical protein
VAGRPGIGKTTLVQTVKSDAQAAGYWTSDEIIPISAEGVGEQLLGQLLSGVYDAALASHPTAKGPEVEAAQQLVRTIRLRGTPAGALLLDGPRVLRGLLGYAMAQGARGIVLHLNNLENLSEADAVRAADLLRGIRDQALLHDGLHLIVVGTTDAVRTVVQSHTQIRSVFSNPLMLQPLELDEVQTLLAHRYEVLQLDQARPWRSPVENSVVQRLYELFRGDLRGMLKALEDGITALLGLTSAGAEVAPVGTAALQTQAQLVEVWQIKQPSVSQTLQQLIEAGAVEALPRRGREPIQYLMTGTARLAL